MILTDAEQVQYLANVLYIARADGALSAVETQAIEAVRGSVGAKKTTMTNAQKQVEKPTFALAHLRAFESRVCNVADMMLVALSDGELEEAERHAVCDFARAVPLSEEQTALLLSEAITQAVARTGDITCGACGSANHSSAKFCSSCGSALEAHSNKGPALTYDIPKEGHAIEFAESTAAAFHSALEYAQTAPTVLSCEKNKKTWYVAAWPHDQFASAVRMAELLSGIRNRRAYRDGQEVPWDDEFGFVWCAKNRASAFKPTLYCFGQDEGQVNPWGCKLAQLPWTEWGRWFSYGEWTQAGLLRSKRAWRFDKNRIRHEALSNTHRTRNCLHFRPQLIDAILRALPDQVEVSDGGDWKYSRSYEQVPGAIKVVEVERIGGSQYTTEIWADGVRPRGIGALREVLRKAFAEAGVKDVETGDLQVT